MTADFEAAITNYAKAGAPFSTGAVAGPRRGTKITRGTAFPYCVLLVVGAPELNWSTDRRFLEPVRIQFSMYAKGEAEAFGYAAQLTARFDYPTITVLGQPLGVQRISGPFSAPCEQYDSDAAPVFHVVTDYRCWLQGP
jgi:hypothetical protein